VAATSDLTAPVPRQFPSATLLARSADLLADWSRPAFTIALFLIGAYLVGNQQIYVGLLLVGVSFVRWSAESHWRTLLNVVADTRVSTTIHAHLNLEAILDHPAARSASNRLRQLGRLPADSTHDQWTRSLIERFQQRASVSEGAGVRVTFECRGGQVWINGEHRPFPGLVHEFVIPDDAQQRKHSDLWPGDEAYAGVRVRVIVINGILKLQIGEWDEETGYREAGQQYDWMAWDTITTFPLLLNPIDHRLSPRLLLCGYFSYPIHRKDWHRMKRLFGRQADDYCRALRTFGEYGENRRLTAMNRDFEYWLREEGFKRLSVNEPPFQPVWSNRFLYLELRTSTADFDAYQWLSDVRSTHS
jgi:hypothetical protein